MDEVMTVGDAASSSIKTLPAPLLASNLPLLSAFLAGAIAQFLKLFTTWYPFSALMIFPIASSVYISPWSEGSRAYNLLCFGFWTLRYKERKWESKRMLDSGGMPSSHSATVTALAVAIALQEGSGGPAFAIALVFACVVCAWFFLSFLFTCLFSFLYFLLLMLWLLKEFGKFWASASSAVHSSIVQCLFGILIYNLG